MRTVTRNQKLALSCCVRIILRSTLAIVLSAAGVLLACASDKSQWTDAQLRLTPEQARGRKIYNQYCAGCHSAYSSKKLNGPSLKDLYKKRAMPSGAPPTDERIAAVTLHGRRMMPGFADAISQQKLDALLAYLRTL